MIVALHITSESGDHYLKLYKDRSPCQIREELWGEESFYGCSISYEVLDCSESEEKELNEVLNEVQEESWNWC